MRKARDIEKDYPLPDFIDKLRRLADALESGDRFQIQIAGQRISVPVGATFNNRRRRLEMTWLAGQCIPAPRARDARVLGGAAA